MPADESSTTWASQTSQTPMPIHLELTSIAELFTDNFKTDFEREGIDYKKLHPLVVGYLARYCQQLADANKVKDCLPPTGKSIYLILTFNVLNLLFFFKYFFNP